MKKRDKQNWCVVIKEKLGFQINVIKHNFASLRWIILQECQALLFTNQQGIP